jgi:hypothetical protein
LALPCCCRFFSAAGDEAVELVDGDAEDVADGRGTSLLSGRHGKQLLSSTYDYYECKRICLAMTLFPE